METSEQRPASHAVLTLEILEHQAEAISAWLRETFSIEAVELYFPPRPGGGSKPISLPKQKPHSQPMSCRNGSKCRGGQSKNR